MTNEEKETLMDRLLVFMNEEVECHGETIECVDFDFSKDQEDANNALEKININYVCLCVILKVSLSRKYITYKYMGCEEFGGIGLTEEGQARAISVLNAKSQKTTSVGDIHIGTLNANAPTQIGNYNKQDIQNVFQYLNDQIEHLDAPVQEKENVKKLLDDLLKHPLTQTILGGALSLGTKFIGN